jgi:glycosyltransferase involved in cell wall biosynthesis
MVGTWARCIDLMIAPSEFLRSKLVQGGFDPARIVVKPSFVYPDPGAGSGDGDYALFVGRLAGEKGIEALIEAWKLIGAEVPLKVVGDGPMAEALARTVGAVPGVTWLGRRSRDEVFELMGRARCVVVPSAWYEVLPVVMLEAFATGAPLIVADLGAPADLVRNMETGLRFKVGDATDLARQVRRMFDGSIDVVSMRVRARREYELRYSEASNYDALTAIYASVARRPGTITSGETLMAEGH